MSCRYRIILIYGADLRREADMSETMLLMQVLVTAGGRSGFFARVISLCYQCSPPVT